MIRLRLIAASVAATLACAAHAASPAPNGIALPAGFQDWKLIAPSHRTDDDTIRVILGNDVAARAARAGKTNPWPDGAMLAKLVWNDATLPEWPTAQAPGNFVNADFMVRDAGKYRTTGGWGFARWLGPELTPYGKDAAFDQECYGCHTAVESRGFVFTRPVKLP